MNEHLISLESLTPKELHWLLEKAAEIKKWPECVKDVLKGKNFALIFEKPSTRTWVSFEVGISSMGGAAIYLGPGDIQLDVREPTKDVARVLSRYLDGVILRTFKHKTVEVFAKYFSKPVINGLTDKAHPCQALADFLTLKENFGNVKGLTLAYVGDANNVLNSLLVLGAKLGTHIHYACPKPYVPSAALLKRVARMAKQSGAKIRGFTSPEKAVKGARAVYTDVWVSMGEEKVALTKKKSFKGFQVNRRLMKLASKDAIALHCLPAHRDEEITSEIIESKASRVFDQAENRLHAQKAVLAYLFKK